MSPFQDEVKKVDDAVQSVTSRWKTWGLALAFLFAATVLIYAVVKFWF